MHETKRNVLMVGMVVVVVLLLQVVSVMVNVVVAVCMCVCLYVCLGRGLCMGLIVTELMFVFANVSECYYYDVCVCVAVDIMLVCVAVAGRVAVCGSGGGCGVWRESPPGMCSQLALDSVITTANLINHCVPGGSERQRYCDPTGAGWSASWLANRPAS